MATRSNYSAASSGESSNTTSTPSNKVTLTYTPDDNSDYLEFFSCLTQIDSTGVDYVGDFYDNTAGSQLCYHNWEPKDSSDYKWQFGIAKKTYGASPASQTRYIRYANETGSQPSRIKNATAWALKFGAADQYAESNGESTTTSTSYQDKTTLTFTPASTGDYLIIWAAEGQASGTGENNYYVLDIGGAEYQLCRPQFTDASSYMAVGGMMVANLANSSQTIKIKYKSNVGTVTAKIRNARIFALRLDAFANALQTASDGGQDNTASTSYQDGATVTFTPAARNHLVLACAMGVSSDNTESGFWKFLQGATDHGEALAEPRANANNLPTTAHLIGYIESLAASSTTWKWQYKAETSNTTYIDEQVIAVLDLEEASGTTYNDTISYGITAGYSLADAMTWGPTLTEAITAGYSLSSIAEYGVTIAESVTVGDAMAGIATYDNNTLSEGITPGDTLVGGLLIEESVSETITAGYSAVVQIDFNPAITEAVTTDYSVDSIAELQNDITEAITAGNTLAVVATFESALSESVSPDYSLDDTLESGGGGPAEDEGRNFAFLPPIGTFTYRRG